MKIYSKHPTSISEQLELLIERGLLIQNYEDDARQLQVIGYYRLTGYLKPFQINDRFNEGTTINQVLDLYDYDRKLRLCLLGALERIEIAFKAIVNYYMSLKYGTHWYELLRFSQIRELITNHKGIYDAKNYGFIKHYQATYQTPVNPPSWMVFEVLGFADLSKICSHLPHRDLKVLAKFCDHSSEVIISWLRSLTVTRNICAHHARLWDRVYSISPKRTKEISHVKHKSTAEQILIIAYLLNKIDYRYHWKSEVIKILEAIKLLVNLSYIGFDNNSCQI